jgi:uncharacterized membrane protein YcaP (DUF421 family)
MWTLSLAWWELPLRAVFIYVALLVMMRLSGKRTVGQSTSAVKQEKDVA